jgi:hypothetical protein
MGSVKAGDMVAKAALGAPLPYAASEAGFAGPANGIFRISRFHMGRAPSFVSKIPAGPWTAGSLLRL